MKITKRIREEAAVMCAIAASTDWNGSVYDPAAPPRDTAAGQLAWAAEALTWSVWRKRFDWSPETHWAEAEALLRTGWTP